LSALHDFVCVAVKDNARLRLENHYNLRDCICILEPGSSEELGINLQQF